MLFSVLYANDYSTGCSTGYSSGNSKAYYNVGKDFAQSLQHNSLSNFPLNNVNSNPKEGSITVEQMRSHRPNKEVLELINNAKNRKEIVHYNDPIITSSQNLIKDPLKHIDGQMSYPHSREEITYETKVCKEPGEPYTEVCTRSLNIPSRRATFRKSYGTVVHYNTREWVQSSHGYLVSQYYIPHITYPDLIETSCHCDPNLKSQFKLGAAQGVKFDFSVMPEVKVLNCNRRPEITKSWTSNGELEINIVFPLLDRCCFCRSVGKHLCPPISNGIKFELEINYIKSDNPQEEFWQSNCQELDRLSDQGFCAIVDRKCLSGPETRNIDGVPTYRSCWQEQLTYLCEYPTTCTNNCESLRAQGCEQINSKCSQLIAGKCIEWTNTFSCPSGKKMLKVSQEGQSSMFCLDGSCHEVSYMPNNEMADSLAKLQMFKEMQVAYKADDHNQIKIFSGTSLGCSKSFANFKDCCGTHRGWGMDLNLSNCNGEERQLSENRNQGLCHVVGTYVAEKFMGQWLRKKTTFCCFPSKLIRIIHEQGRPQIDLGWGSPERPDCRGFSIEELCKLDFDHIDMSEFLVEVQKRYKAPNMGAINQNLENQMKVMTDNLANNSKNYKQEGMLRKKQEELYKEMK